MDSKMVQERILGYTEVLWDGEEHTGESPKQGQEVTVLRWGPTRKPPGWMSR